MANKDGIITRKDIIEDEALKFGEVYAENIQKAIDANKVLVGSVKELNKQVQAFKVANSQKDYITAKQAEALATQQAIDAIKKQEAAEISADKVKRSAIATMESERKAREASEKATQRANTEKERSKKLTIEERVQNEINNKALKQEALERLGLVSAYTKLNAARTEAKNKLRDLIASESASTAEIKKAQKEFENLDGKVRKADQAVGDFTKNVGNYPKLTSFTSGIKDLIGAFGIVGGLTAFAAVAKNIFETTKELQSLDLALKSVTGTQSEFADQQLFLSSISQKYGLEIKNLTKQFISFYVAAKDKISGKEIQEIFENISKSGSALGLSNETLERSFQAVNQMLSKGTVASEELRGQLAESMPGAIQAMTKAVQKLHPEIKNLTEKGLFEMIKSGKILANEVLPETARQLVIMTGADKAQGIETLTKLTNRLSNEWTDMIRSINETDTSGFGIFVKKIVSGLSNILTFTSLLFKSEDQLTTYFTNLGKQKGFEEFDAIMKNIGTTSKENQELVKKELLFRERETIRVNTAIVKSEKEKRASIIGGDRALFHLQTKAEEDALVKIGKSAEIIKKIKESNVKPIAIAKSDGNGESDAERKKRLEKEKSDRDKALLDRLASEKKLSDSLYELQKQRLEQTIKFNDEIVADDLQSDEMRIQALTNSQKKQQELLLLTKNHLLDEDKLTANDRIRINEDYSNKLLELNSKTQKELDKINLFDEAKYTKDLEDKISKQNVAMNSELEAENKKFLALGDLEKMSQKDREAAIEAHEKEIFDIKKRYAIEALNLQISNLETELTASDALPVKEQLSAEKRQKIAETLSKAKLDLSEVELSNNDKKNEKTVEEEKLSASKILDISAQLTAGLSDLANAVFEAKIQNIEEEITKNNEYYDKQIELAGNDQRQKDLLEKERDKKNEELEKKKRKEQHKQAVFNKASAVAQAGISTALAILAALNTQPFLPLGPTMAALAGVMGAIQIGAILATPIPKYKGGRNGGKEEFAYVGDGGVSEVIERKRGGIEITPATDTLVKLYEGDKVHSSVDAYNKLQRAAMMASIDVQGRKSTEFQANYEFEKMYGKELLREMQEVNKNLKKQKNGTIINIPKNDFGHEFWKMKNKNWS